MSKRKQIECWYDVETTGLSVDKGAAVVQIALLIIEDDVEVKKFNFNINPYSYRRAVTIDPYALTINGYKEGDFDSYKSLEEVMVEVMNYLTVTYPSNKLTLCGYNNSTFDKYFIEDMFNDIGRKFQMYFNWKQIDVFELVKALQFMGVMTKTFNQKLGTIGEYLKIPLRGELHDALTDVYLTRDIYLKIKKELV